MFLLPQLQKQELHRSSGRAEGAMREVLSALNLPSLASIGPPEGKRAPSTGRTEQAHSAPEGRET